MKKTLFILAIALCGALTLSAQTPIKGFLSGASSSSLVDASFGMPLAGSVTTSSGIIVVTVDKPFSQLAKVDFGDTTVMGGIDLAIPDATNPTFYFKPVTKDNDGVNLKYMPLKSSKKFDLVAKVTLNVIPCGPDVYAKYTDGHYYESVPIKGASGKYYCWTKTNLKESASGVVYDNNTDPDFETTYGRLYTWSEAVTPTGSIETKSNPSDATETYVQGICPDKWHIPTAAEKADLLGLDVATLNHPSLWQGTHPTYTNTTGFTAVPAGIYNDELDRFEGLGTQTDWWTDNGGTVGTTIPVIEFSYYCTSPMDKTMSANKGLSVRCVRENYAPEP